MDFLDKLESNANELDLMVKEVTVILNEETKGWKEFSKNTDAKNGAPSLYVIMLFFR